MPLDPDLEPRVELLRPLTTADVLAPGPDAQRALDAYNAPFAGYERPAVDIREERGPGPHGDVPVRLYAPPGGGSGRPGLVWLHGGAFMHGDLDMPEADVVSRELCVRAGAVVASVDYRLAVDGVSFPVAHEDVLAAWAWAVEGASGLGIDAGRLALGGASAGGNLAAGAVLRLRDDRLPAPSRLLLVYPLLHERLPAPGARLKAELDRLPAATRFPPDLVAAINGNYLGGAPAGPYAFPALGELAGLPPTLIALAEYDDLRPSGEEFADALAAAGVECERYCEPGVTHGHLNLEGLPAAARTLAVLARALTAPAPVGTT
jgi:acetyl esterase